MGWFSKITLTKGKYHETGVTPKRRLTESIYCTFAKHSKFLTPERGWHQEKVDLINIRNKDKKQISPSRILISWPLPTTYAYSDENFHKVTRKNWLEAWKKIIIMTSYKTVKWEIMLITFDKNASLSGMWFSREDFWFSIEFLENE